NRMPKAASSGSLSASSPQTTAGVFVADAIGCVMVVPSRLCVAEPPCGSVVLLLHHHVDRQRRRQCQAPEWLHRGWGEVHDVGVGVGEQFGGEASPLLGDTSHLVRRAVEDGEVLRPPVLGSYLSDARPG